MLQKLGAVGAILFGSVIGLGVLSNLGSGHAPTAIAGALVLFSAAPIGSGFYLLLRARRHRRTLDAAAESAWEVELLRLAQERGGDLTVAEVVAATGLAAARAEGALDGLARRGLAEHRIADDGTIVYRLARPLTAEEKSAARGVLE